MCEQIDVTLVSHAVFTDACFSATGGRKVGVTAVIFVQRVIHV